MLQKGIRLIIVNCNDTIMFGIFYDIRCCIYVVCIIVVICICIFIGNVDILVIGWKNIFFIKFGVSRMKLIGYRRLRTLPPLISPWRILSVFAFDDSNNDSKLEVTPESLIFFCIIIKLQKNENLT